MLKKDKFKQLFADIERIRRVAEAGSGKNYWEVFNAQGNLLGFAFYLEVPETPPHTEEVAEFDKYEVWGITNTELGLNVLEIAPHPGGPENLWTEGVTEAGYVSQFLGLSTDEMRLSPAGMIDAVTDGTISSKLLAEAIRIQLEFMTTQINGS
ncbi:MAG: hypothetical protein HY879_22095 [Deltaproteobacteria bacterium]|nr:hypothetical protein [Deltaproteobacteria bacterium]